MIRVLFIALILCFSLFPNHVYAVINWQTNTPMSSVRVLPAVTKVTNQGGTIIYAVGGGTSGAACSMGYGDGKVFFAKQDLSNGVLDAWQETGGGSGTFIRVGAGIAESNGYIYIAGGAINSPLVDASVWYAKPADNGTISSWTQSPNPTPNWVGSFPYVASHNGYLYVGGGRNDAATPKWSNRLYYSQINPSTGAPGSWQNATDLPSATGAGEGALVFYGGYAYLILGRTSDTTISDKVYYTTVTPATGALGTWTETTPLPYATSQVNASFFVEPDRLYVLMGGTDVYYSKVRSDGTLGQWIQDSSLPVARTAGKSAVRSGDYYYIVGNYDCTGSTTVYSGKGSLGGSIIGSVTDSSAKPIGGVTVKLYPPSPNNTMIRSTMTNPQGTYTFDNLPGGNYRVLFDTNGFATQAYNNRPDLASADNVNVVDGQTTVVQNASLTISTGYNRYLGVVKTGLGTIVDNHGRINCGTVCTAAY
ncbi:MAG: carboxypeptidase-like regulatory domain-containing protein, partial [Thermodesulfovibrionales bacterium]